jgi:hypothetical protein
MSVEQAGSDSAAIDAALAGIGESPMEKTAEAPAEAAAPAAPEWKGDDWKFNWNGRDIVPESREKLITWANQGYNYSQRMGELNKTHAQRMAEAEARELKAKEIESKYSPFAQVNEYAEKNPDWWNHVKQSFEQRQAQEQGLDPKLAEILTPLQQKLSQMEQEAEARRAAEEQAKVHEQHTKEDQALESEIEAIRKQHPNIDLSARDESGETLERRILLHASENGIRSFRAAYRDYLHDQLVVQQGAQTRLQAVRGQQAEAKAGLLGKTPAPTKELRRVDTSRPWSDPQFSDIQAILAEHRQVNGG